ncbi:amino acid adenylation domain-containing protein [Roseomonas stagni]|uniref:Amino acid adenylation domain-containing protein n=1 Tax=Falsiroseomonas algicola TaxID=2716930 RepID=A0A6M1LI33_9PROT|nr:non-ribosomal peptide synthetase [Falsiroseomonas algicola]NGM19911.1 amino acid adenylation domain-containing protein [Falsiroseomonas algicola]
MTTAAFLQDLERRGVTLSVSGDEVSLRAPRGVLTEADRDRLRAEKAAILALLRGDDTPADEPFPLTEIQQAYLVGRSAELELGRVGCHAYREFESDSIDLDRLEEAWNRLVARHPMLRAVVTPDGRQRVLPEVPRVTIERIDLREAADAGAVLAAERETRSHHVFDPQAWPLFSLKAALLPDGRVRLGVGIDLLLADAAALVTLFRDWGALYAAPDAVSPPPAARFADHARRLPQPSDRDRAYWQARLADFPPGPDLPLLPVAGPPRFTRRTHRIPAAEWQALRAAAAARGITASVLLATALADALAGWSRRSRFAITLTQFAAPPGMEGVVGDFTSTILLEADVTPPRFEDRARALQARLAADLDHASMSGVAVLREIRRLRPEAAAVPVVFTSTVGHPSLGGATSPLAWLGETVFAVTQTPQVVLDHHVFEEAGALVLGWDAVEAAFPPGVLDALVAAQAGLLAALLSGEGWTRDASACRPSQPRASLTEAAPPRLLHVALEEAARATPDRPAVIDAERVLDHATLHAAAGHLAATLRERLGGETRNRLVAIVLPKGWRQVVAVLAVLKAGAAYLPVDPALPSERRRHLIAQGEALPIKDPADIDAALAAAHQGPPPALPAIDDPSRLAYVIYTSGSTGQPKGVMIEHQAAVATVDEINRRWAIGAEDRAFGLSALGFDLSVWDIFGPLAKGGAVVLPPPEAARDPGAWAALLARHRVTVWNSVPALMAMQMEHGLPVGHALRLVMMSGDWVPVELVRRLQAALPQAALVALGGATEAAIWSNAHEIGALDPAWPSIPYGLPLAGQMLHVVDARGAPCPDWVTGEIEISGAGLARGYWRDPVRTAERFVTNPFTGERRYRTGDLGRFRPHGDGTGPTPIEFLGREDFQVKIQGYRIELGEIEAALESHPEVAASCATVVEGPGGKALHAFVAPRRESWDRARRVLCRPGLRRDGTARLPLPHRASEESYDTRRTIRRFTEATPPPAALEAVVAAAGMPVTVLNRAEAGWPGIAIPDPATARVAAAAGALLLLEAPRSRTALLAAGRAGQRMMQAAEAQGLGLCAIGLLLKDGAPVLHAFACGVPATEVAGIDLAGALREHCAALLPAYMVPRHLHLLESLPLSANGKVDRAALKPPSQETAAPAGATESGVAALVAEALGQAVASQRNLFDAGATSLHMVRLQRLLAERMGSRLSVVDLFRLPSIAAIAGALAGEAAEGAVQGGLDRAARRRAAQRR